MEGNQMKMHEALESARNWCLNRLGNASYQVTVEGLLSVVDAALAKPRRNCDVGTSEEQAERYGRYCDKFTRDGMHCETCPCCGKIPFGKCEFAWAQMPYAQEGDANA